MVLAEYCWPGGIDGSISSNLMFVTDTMERAKEIINAGYVKNHFAGTETDQGWRKKGAWWIADVNMSNAFYRLTVVEYKE